MERKHGKQRLRDAGLRATQSRMLVLAFLAETRRPVTHGEVVDALEDRGLDRATIYRNLVDLADAGIARRSDFGDHVWRFELAHADEPDDSHVHFVCRSCGVVACLPEDTVAIRKGPNIPSALLGNVEINISGVCDTCA